MDSMTSPTSLSTSLSTTTTAITRIDIGHLHREIITLILEYLPIKSLRRTMVVCRAWKDPSVTALWMDIEWHFPTYQYCGVLGRTKLCPYRCPFVTCSCVEIRKPLRQWLVEGGRKRVTRFLRIERCQESSSCLNFLSVVELLVGLESLKLSDCHLDKTFLLLPELRSAFFSYLLIQYPIRS